MIEHVDRTRRRSARSASDFEMKANVPVVPSFETVSKIKGCRLSQSRPLRIAAITRRARHEIAEGGRVAILVLRQIADGTAKGSYRDSRRARGYATRIAQRGFIDAENPFRHSESGVRVTGADHSDNVRRADTLSCLSVCHVHLLKAAYIIHCGNDRTAVHKLMRERLSL